MLGGGKKNGDFCLVVDAPAGVYTTREKHRENRKIMPREHLIGYQGVKCSY